MDNPGLKYAAIKSLEDVRDYQWHEYPQAGIPVDWSIGYDVEKEVSQKIGKPFILSLKDQGQSGSCFPGGTLILCEDLSYKPISDVTIGDFVITHLGKKEKVITKYQKKWQGTMKKVFIWGDYRNIEVTPEHPFYSIKKPFVKRHKKNKWIKNDEILKNIQPEFYQIKELKKYDWVAMPFNNIIEDKTIFSYEKDPDFLWVLGLYMAEGSCDKYKVAFSLHKDELDWYEKIKRIMNKYGANVTYSLKKPNGLCISIQGERWVKIFSELGNNLCENKKLDKRLMLLDPSLQKYIVNGVSDGDGHYRRNTCTIKSTSYEMLVQLRTILLRNGISSSFCKEKKYEDKKQVYTLEYNLKGFSRYSFIKGNYIFTQIKSISHKKANNHGYVYNLEVEKDNSYQVNGIAVHNCGGQAYSYYGEVLSTFYDLQQDEKSAKFIYAPISQKGGGSSGRDLSNRVVNVGFADETICPSYENGNPPSESFMECWQDITLQATNNAAKDKVFEYAFVKPTIDLIANAIQSNHGAIIGIVGTNNGTWRSELPQQPLQNSEPWFHWLYFGKFKLINGKKYLGFKNSWGPVGDKGWQWISEDYVNVPFLYEGTPVIFEVRTLVYNENNQKITLMQKIISLLTQIIFIVQQKAKSLIGA